MDKSALEETIRSFALGFPQTAESPHFEKISFRYMGKIFATLNADTTELVIKLSEIDQHSFSNIPGHGIEPVPNKWGKQGWTIIHLNKTDTSTIAEAIKGAYFEVGGKL